MSNASLYNHFSSKDHLALAFLERREEIWTRGWLESEIMRRASNPDKRLLAVFDVFDIWFRKRSFEGCAFIAVLLETRRGAPLHRSAARHLGKIRGLMQELAEDAGLREPKIFASTWHMLMNGSIIAAAEGNRNTALEAKRAAQLLIDNWARH